MDLYLKYSSILEQNDYNKSVNIDDLQSYPLYLKIKNYIEKEKFSNILISLSGGVDSMVLLFIINHIKQHIDGLNVYCCHINYNNRDESVDERDFLIEYCYINNIILDVKNIEFKRSEIKRNVYEKETRQLRYNNYYDLSNKFNSNGVFLAHHKDDICENIFNNVMRGCREITDLTVIKERNTILNVLIHRPMLDFYKDDILEISHQFNIPYFLDTTPDWSCRGKMRRNIFPKCSDCYTDNYKNSLLKLGKESEEVSEILNKYIIDVIMDKVTLDNQQISIPNEIILKENHILKIIVRKLCHKYGIENMKLKCVDEFSRALREKRLGKIKMTLLKNYSITINIDHIYFDKVII